MLHLLLKLEVEKINSLDQAGNSTKVEYIQSVYE